MRSAVPRGLDMALAIARGIKASPVLQYCGVQAYSGRVQHIERYGERFLSRIFTEIERRKSDNRAGCADSYAKRFAAKEAYAKALGTGFRQGVFWRDMGVVNLPTGQPTVKLTGGARSA